MIDFDFNKECTGCSACSDCCPTGSIQMVINKWGFIVPRVESNTCIDCGKCDKTCPVLNTHRNKDCSPHLYCAYNRDAAQRARGSSGSIMLAVAQYVLSLGGCVYGAAFIEKFKVVHTRATTLEGVYP